jgi:DNA-binding MarR family transcriptional regulator
MLSTLGPRNALVALIDELIRAHGRLKSIFTDVNAASGLSSMESTVLAAVVESVAAPTVAQIGRSLGYPRQVIQRAANTLIAAGLVETAPNPSHKRAMLLVATREGRSRKQQAETHAEDVIRPLLARLDAAKCRSVAEDLRELRSEIEAFLRSQRKKR